MPLTVKAIEAAKPRDVGYRLPDGGGLHLFVTPSGIRSWRWRYEVGGKERTAILGRYPEMTLANARRARDQVRDNLRATGDLSAAAPPPAPSFETAAREWHALNLPRWTAHHAEAVLASFVSEVFPQFGATPVDRVSPETVLAAIRKMEARGAIERARRVKQRCATVFAFAISSGWAQTDPTSPLKAALAPMPKPGHRPAVLTLEDARAVIQSIDCGTGHPTTRVALRFTALTAARPGEVNAMVWSEIEGDVWRIPAERMKPSAGGVRTEHVIPLAPAALECLNALRPINGRSRFVFPNAHNPRRHMSENAMGFMLARLGWTGRHVPHGWRATFSSIMNERFPADRQVIDLMLAHSMKDQVERAYNRAAHTARRRELAELWADMLLGGAAPVEDLITGARRAPG